MAFPTFQEIIPSAGVRR